MACEWSEIQEKEWSYHHSWLLIENEDEELFWDFQCNGTNLKLCEGCSRRKNLSLDLIGADLDGDKIVGIVETVGVPGNQKYGDS